MDSIWGKRLREFYIEITKYVSIIAMSIFYSFIIFGSIFTYYYFQFLNWLPPSFPTELLASLFFAFMFLRTKVRTFMKNADIIFLTPIETHLVSYFRNSILYSALIEVIRLLFMIVIIAPLVNPREVFNIPFLIIFSGLIILNFQLTWIEQWLNNKLQYIGHRIFRFSLFSATLYLMFTGHWAVTATLVFINLILWFYIFENKTRGVNWEYLIAQEEKSLVRIYKFINIFTDVPQFKHSFNRRTILGWCIKKA